MDIKVMKWHWFALLAGLGLYILVLVPGLLPHTLDIVAVILAGVTIASVAVFGFDSTHVDGRLATLMVGVSLALLIAGIILARQGHSRLGWLLSAPAIGLGLFVLQKILGEQGKE